MKSLFTFLFFLFLITTSCNYNVKPTFIKIEKIKIKNISEGSVIFIANAIFKNNNDIGGKLFIDNIDVFANEIQVGSIQTKEFKVPAKDTFSIPLTGNFSADKILNNNNDIISNVLNIIASKKIPIRFKGDLLFKKGLFKYTYHIDKTNRVRIKL